MAAVRNWLRLRLEDVADAVFPAACRHCGRALPDECAVPRAARPYAALWNGQLRRPVCGAWSLPLRLVCPLCAIPLVRAPRGTFALAGGTLRCAAAFEPAPVLFDLIHALKYESQVQLVPWLGAFLAAALRAAAEADALLVPVPLHPRRERARGFNQSHLLAVEAGRRLGLTVGHGLLERVRDTPPQARLPHGARAANVAAAFRLSARVPHGRPLVIVDDVVTTGSTAAAAAAALGADPCRTVVAALCRAHPGGG